MKQYQPLLILLLLSLFVASCSAIAGIFKAGVGFGVIISIVIVAAVIILMMRSGKK